MQRSVKFCLVFYEAPTWKDQFTIDSWFHKPVNHPKKFLTIPVSAWLLFYCLYLRWTCNSRIFLAYLSALGFNPIKLILGHICCDLAGAALQLNVYLTMPLDEFAGRFLWLADQCPSLGLIQPTSINRPTNWNDGPQRQHQTIAS